MNLTLSLDPPELGRIQIALSAGGNDVSVTLTAQEGATHHLLQGQVESLRQRLGELGVSVGQLDVRHDGAGARQHGGSERPFQPAPPDDDAGPRGRNGRPPARGRGARVDVIA